jgi:hypothetical protein
MIFSTKSALIGIIGAVAIALSANAVASGSESIAATPNNSARLYNVGKGVYADKFSCSGCPLAGKSLDANLAKEVLSGKPKVELTAEETEALSAYLKRRFNV